MGYLTHQTYEEDVLDTEERDPSDRRYYILVQPWAVYVKAGQFFIDQGGLRDEWGKKWELVYADSIEHARLIGEHSRCRR